MREGEGESAGSGDASVAPYSFGAGGRLDWGEEGSICAQAFVPAFVQVWAGRCNRA